MSKYNGWANYETWNVALWMQNDEGLYNLAHECKNYAEYRDRLRELGVIETPDKVSLNDTGIDLQELDDCINEMRS